MKLIYLLDEEKFLLLPDKEADNLLSGIDAILIDEIKNKYIKDKQKFLEEYLKKGWSFTKWLKLHQFVGKKEPLCHSCGREGVMLYQFIDEYYCYDCMKDAYNELKENGDLWDYIVIQIGGFADKF